jgi:peptidoglycan/xylan/chitin deacetylase (PgdA/CDA1 family)
MRPSRRGIKALLVGAAASAGVMAYAVRGRSSSLLAPSVYKGTTNRRAIALTFDDGPSESSPQILEVLDRFGTLATFFQCGANACRLPEVARSIAESGHEIGNHSETHPHFYFRSASFIYNELAAAQRSIRDATGVSPKFFRPPFGVRWFGLREAQARLNLTGVMWTTIGVDWRYPEKQIVHQLVTGARSGAILCLHDGRELHRDPDVTATIGALKQVLPILIDKGFHFERVHEILCPKI